jgi:hypothetical protein
MGQHGLESSVPTRQLWPWGLLVLGYGLLGVMAATASIEQSLQAAGIPGPDFPHRPQVVQFCRTAAHLGELTQLAVGVLGPNLLHGLLEALGHGVAAALREQSLHAARVLESELSSVVLLLGELSLLTCAFYYPRSNGSHETCLHQGVGFPDISG